jgi:FAD/FMN-containing dehydrogenase
LVAGLGCADVRTSRGERLLYATDASMYQVDPILVVVPRDVDEAVRDASWCVRRGVPLLPRGGGTSLNGQTVNLAVVLGKKGHIKFTHVEALTATPTWDPSKHPRSWLACTLQG